MSALTVSQQYTQKVDSVSSPGLALLVGCLVAIALAVVVVEWGFSRERAALDRSPRVLAERARGMLAAVGHDRPPVDQRRSTSR